VTDYMYVAGQVTVTYSADDTGTIRNTNLNAQKSLGLYGDSEFQLREGNNRTVKYTVNEDTTQINKVLGATGSVKTVELSLTNLQIKTLNSIPVVILATPGANYAYQFISAFLNYDRATADITGNLTVDLINSTTLNVVAKATAAFTPSSDTITRFVEQAGTVVENEGLTLIMNGGDPTMGASTGIAKVTLSYKIIAV